MTNRNAQLWSAAELDRLRAAWELTNDIAAVCREFPDRTRGAVKWCINREIKRGRLQRAKQQAAEDPAMWPHFDSTSFLERIALTPRRKRVVA